MSWLLHSKRFRVNLKKWLCMYVGVILTFTTVITYSRYVSTFTASSSARVAKFKVDIYCEDGKTGQCSNDMYSRYQPITYRFTMDRDLEVETKLELKVLVDSKFQLETITDITHGQLFYSRGHDLGNISFTNNGSGVFSLERIITPSVKDSSIYEVTVSYIGNDSIKGTDVLNTNVVKIGYVAIQQT